MPTTTVLFALTLGHLVLGQDPQVTTSQGTIKGQILESRDGREYFSFTRIPFAKPPVGERRFMISEKADNWTGILDATQNITYCYQPNAWGYGPAYIGEEDCLYLNVFSPNLTGRYPVIFSIHGGAFSKGSADIFRSASFFMDEDVVFVAPHYRLGTLGFLSLEDQVIPGNNGLKDQALALEWVKKEISAFGGDPDSITVVGQSAGGASSDFICSAPRTNGLIKACVSQSGVGASPWAMMEPGVARKMALNLTKALGCNVTSEILKCLQSKPLEQVANSSLMVDKNNDSHISAVLENAGVPDALITRWPTGTNHSYPWIMGVCQDDGSIFIEGYESNTKSKEEIQKFINGFNQTLISTYHLENRTKDFQRLWDRYFIKGVEPLRAIRNYYSEAMFVYPTLKSLSEHPGSTYFYKFNYTRGPMIANYPEVPHAADLAYFFGSSRQVPGWPNAQDTELSKQLVKMWVNFARDHNPSSQGTTQWPQFQGQYYLDIQDFGVGISNWSEYQETLDFWKYYEDRSKLTTS